MTDKKRKAFEDPFWEDELLQEAIKYVDENYDSLEKEHEPILDVFLALMHVYGKHDTDGELIWHLELALMRLYRRDVLQGLK